MTQPTDRLFRLPARGFAQLFQELGELRRRHAEGDPDAAIVPRVSVWLGDAAVEGAEFVDFFAGEPAGRGATVLLKDGVGDAPWDVRYVGLDAVKALRVHLTEETAHLVSFGRLRRRVGEAPSRLELARRLIAASDAVGSAAGRQIAFACDLDVFPDNEEIRHQLATLFQDLQAVLCDLAGAADGKAALSQIASVQARIAVATGVIREGANLVAAVRLADGNLELLARAKLKAALMARL